MALLPGPGVFFVLPCVDNYCKVDLRTVCELSNSLSNGATVIMALKKLFILAFDVPPQEVLTKDSVTVSVDAVVYYRVSAALTQFRM